MSNRALAARTKAANIRAACAASLEESARVMAENAATLRARKRPVMEFRANCHMVDEHQEQPTDGSFAPPDIYAAPIAAMRAASATEPNFEDGWKAKRTAELSAQRDRMAAHTGAHPSTPRLTAAEVKSYAPPDPYKADLDKMRSERR